LDYINLAYRSMYSLWREEDDFTSASKLEEWFEMNIWANLIDPAFREMEIDLVREGMCLSSSDRENIDRSDGIFRLRKKHLEFGAIEAGRNREGTKGTKLLTDSLKMSKMLKDMINALATECNMKEDVLRKLQIAGILQGANMMQVITVDLPKGYVTRIHRRKFYEVPGRLNKNQSLGLIIMEVLFVKSVIKQALNLINESEVDFEHFLNNYYENDGFQTPPQNIYKDFYYELWVAKNAIKRLKRAREVGKKMRPCILIQHKWIEFMHHPNGLIVKQLAEHYKLLWTIREEMRQYQEKSNFEINL
ncbi:13884_t:CDS:2, partial [Acaulospora morrowiae]